MARRANITLTADSRRCQRALFWARFRWQHPLLYRIASVLRLAPRRAG